MEVDDDGIEELMRYKTPIHRDELLSDDEVYTSAKTLYDAGVIRAQ